MTAQKQVNYVSAISGANELLNQIDYLNGNAFIDLGSSNSIEIMNLNFELGVGHFSIV